MACVWFLTLGARHLLPSDEGRYAEIAREMYASGDWVTIRYNGLKYFEKPPFHLWMTVLAFQAFGVGDWQARLWAAVSGGAGILATAWAVRRWFGRRAAGLCCLVLLAAPTWNIASHFNSLDIGVASALACVLAGLLLAQHPQAAPDRRRAWMWVAWSAMGVAVLTKGLIGIVLPGLALLAYTLTTRDWALWRRLHIVSGMLWMLLITAPWFLLVSRRNPEFAHFFFIHEHWQRYTSGVHRRDAPAWYFVPQLLAGFLPWLGLTRRIGRVVAQDARAEGFKPAVLLACWAGAIFVFFSLSSSKLPGYILPVFPALAVLAALALADIDARSWQRNIVGMLCIAVLGLLASPSVGQWASGNTAQALFEDYTPWIGAACLVMAAGLTTAWHLNRSGRLLASIGAFSLALFAGTTVALVGHESVGRSRAGIDLLAPMRAVLTPGMPIYSVRLLDHTLPFNLRRTMTMVERPDELEFGVAQEPQKWLPTLADFRAAWTNGPHALALMSHATYADLQQQRLPMSVLAQDARRIVVTNFARTTR